MAKGEPYPARLAKGATLVRSTCQHELWWAAEAMPSVASCPHQSPQFVEWVGRCARYRAVLAEAAAEAARLGLPAPLDPLAEKLLPAGPEAAPLAVEAVLSSRLVDLTRTGVGFRCRLFDGRPGWIASGGVADRLLRAGELVVRPAELRDLVDILMRDDGRSQDEREAAYAEAWSVYWRVRDTVDGATPNHATEDI